MAIDAIPVAGPVTRLPPGQWPAHGKWTYEDLLALPDDGNRYEVLEGVLYVSPPPSPQHQDRLFRLCRRLADFIDEHGLGRLFISPVGLLMPGARPVQPDAFFIAADNPAVLDWERHVEGVPDLVIEVASPSTAGYDRREKQDAYARAGVPEYWIVDPWGLAIEVLWLDATIGKYQSQGVYSGDSRLPSKALSGLTHTVAELLG